jgi:sodium-coupled neutral amino acid transporter 11
MSTWSTNSRSPKLFHPFISACSLYLYSKLITDQLAKASTLALLSMTVIILTVLVQGFRVPSNLRGHLTGSLLINNGIFQAIGVISFAFVCHHNSLLIYGSLRKPTLDRFATVTHYSTTISMVACLTMALAGYLTFGDKTQGNVLNNFPSDNIMVNVARLYVFLLPIAESNLN